MHDSQDLIAAERPRGRRWRFGSAVFDEARWMLVVDGQTVAVEAKPLELLRVLLMRAGDAVTKDELLDAVWPGVSVVEASLTTAILKLRRALGDQRRDSPIIETVPRIGYRLAAPVEMLSVDSPGDSSLPSESIMRDDPPRPAQWRWSRWPIFVGFAILLAGGTFAVGRALDMSPGFAPAQPSQMREAASAIRRMDIGQIEALLREGWDPNTPFDDEGNGALNMAINICEWDPAHDRQKLLLLARTLFEGGARLDTRNVWGDTPYSIASAERYCGPDHPVSQMIRTICTAGKHPDDDRCFADYKNASRH